MLSVSLKPLGNDPPEDKLHSSISEQRKDFLCLNPVPDGGGEMSKEVTKIRLTVISHLKIAFYLSCETPDCFIVFAAVLFCLVFVAKGGVEEKDEQHGQF
ncbi:hypothetical protein QQF64_014077 [Cirrhinus molitorella]|uniref:Uncharacterized protein n=1 Tax=Cirrhinus molitorella TaxID=172907 RepID=A0ABR3LVG8_9TELE